MLKYNLLRSIIVGGKYEFLKNWCFILIWEIFCALLLQCWQFHCEIISKRYFGHWFLYIVKKRHSFLYQHICWKGSKPSSWSFFSLDVPLLASMIAEAALYCRGSSFWWKKLLIINYVAVIEMNPNKTFVNS